MRGSGRGSRGVGSGRYSECPCGVVFSVLFGRSRRFGKLDALRSFFTECVFSQGLALVCPVYDWADFTYMYVSYGADTRFYPLGSFDWETSWSGR